jgi:hypothetical protein
MAPCWLLLQKDVHAHLRRASGPVEGKTVQLASVVRWIGEEAAGTGQPGARLVVVSCGDGTHVACMGRGLGITIRRGPSCAS